METEMMSDKVARLEFDLELANCERLYDYVNCKTVTRPNNGCWDPASLDVSNIPRCAHRLEKEEDTRFRVELMDQAIHHGDLLRRPTETTCLPWRVLPVYGRGDVVKGKLLLTLTKPIALDKITINLKGSALVNIKIDHGNYRAEQEYMDETVTVWQNSPCKQDLVKSQSFSKVLILAPLAGALKSMGKRSIFRQLDVGDHEFPFQFIIPRKAGQSMPPLIPDRAVFSHITYRLKATLHRDSVVSPDVETYKGIWVEVPQNIALDPNNLEPVTAQTCAGHGLFGKGGTITAKASLQTKGQIKGQNIPITLEIHNPTNSQIELITARVLMMGSAKLHKNESTVRASRMLDILWRGDLVRHGPLGAGNNFITLKVPWAFSKVDEALLPVGAMTDSCYIDLNYAIQVTVKRPWFRFDLDMKLPIVIGSTAYSS